MPGQHSIDQNGEDPMAQRYDTAFKLTLQHVDVAMRELVGSVVTSWKNIEFPQVLSPRADLLGETKAGELVHFELQSGNAKDMAIRMLEYGLGALRKYHRYPHTGLPVRWRKAGEDENRAARSASGVLVPIGGCPRPGWGAAFKEQQSRR